MVDVKIKTLLTIVETGNYTRAAQLLNLTQPAVSHHIRMLEAEYGIKIFNRNKKELLLTPEGAVLEKNARRVCSINAAARQAIDDCRRQIKHITVGITQTAAESLMPQVMATYCNDHPHTHINIITDTINNIYNRLKIFELDVGIVEGKVSDPSFTSVLLDTDFLCLIVSPEHRFAKQRSVSLRELMKEKFILRSSNAGTRLLFDSYLRSHSETIRNLNVIMEMDNVTMIKELVAQNMGISIIAHSACREEEQQGRLAVVPIENANMFREINMIHHQDFTHPEILEDFRKIYNRLRA